MGDFHYLKIKEYNECYQITYTDRIKEKKEKSHNGVVNKDEAIRCSLSRACSKVKDYVLSNKFDFFVTLTLSDDINEKYNTENSIELFNNKIKNYAKNCKNRGIEFKYIYIFELTKKGAIHIHGFFSGFYDLYINKYGYYSSSYFDKLGFQNYIESDQVNVFYLIKYILKDQLVDHKHIYHYSKNLKKPNIDIIHDNLNNFYNFVFTFKNNYCKMITLAK